MGFLWMLEEIRTPFLNQLMQFITYFGQELIIITVICCLYWCIDKRFAFQLGFTYFTAGLCVQTMKIMFRVPRPWILDPDFPPVSSAVRGATGYSFPSGHTQGATSLFMPLAFRTRKSGRKLFFILCFLLIGFSRMYLGCHTPKDVVVSMGISIFFAWLVWHFQTFFLDDTRYLKPIAAGLMLLSAAAAFYAFYLYRTGMIEFRYASDCFRAAGAGLGFAVGWYLERTRLNFSTSTTHLYSQVVKLILGLAGALAIQKIFPFFFGGSLLAKTSEYFILVLWVIVFYPFLFSRFTSGRKSLPTE